MNAHVAGRGLLCALLGSLALRAQSPPWASLVQAMYRKFEASYDNNRGADGKGEVMILANPGLALTAAQLKDPASISRLLDAIPRPAQLYVPSGNYVSATYERILTLAQTTQVQDMAEQERVRLSKRLLWDRRRPGQPTAMYAAYLKCQADFVTALDAQAVAVAENKATGKAVPPGLDRAVAAARSAWTEKGFKAEVERAKAVIDQGYNHSTPIQFLTLREQVVRARVPNPSGTPFPVLANPPMAEWLAEKGWQPWSFRQTDLAQAAPRTALPLLPAGIRPPLQPGPAGVAALSLSVQLKRVSIARAWMDLGIFLLHTWRLAAASPFPLVSTGNLADQDPGVMPLVVTGLLLARKLTVTGTWSGDAGTGRSLPASLGPFALAGARSAPQPLRQGGPGGFSLKADGAQIVGFFVTPIPRSPTPDPKLFR
jgi:hypothetical protein